LFKFVNRVKFQRCMPAEGESMANTLAAAQILERIYWRACLVVAFFSGVVLIVVAVKLQLPRPAVG
jgi:hypothetical protein